jgi:hypothetical protein
MKIILGLLGIVGSFFMLKYRETIGDLLGEAQWMSKIGGAYNLVVILAILLFFWSLAEMTNTTHLFFKPLLFLFPGGKQWGDQPEVVEF